MLFEHTYHTILLPNDCGGVFHSGVWPIKSKKVSCMSTDKSIQLSMSSIRKPYIRQVGLIIGAIANTEAQDTIFTFCLHF